MELKFRAWLINEQEYYDVHAIDLHKGVITLLNGYHKDTPLYSTVIDKEVILEQSVIFKDDNKKDIFLNDILRVTSRINAKVSYKCFLRYENFEWVTSSGIPFSEIIKDYKVEVVGNVREDDYH